MKEYKVVCTIDIEHKDGRKRHLDMGSVIYGGVPHCLETRDKEIAEKWLKEAHEMVAAYEKWNHEVWNEGKNPNCIKYTQTNIRIVTRTVTEWK